MAAPVRPLLTRPSLPPGWLAAARGGRGVLLLLLLLLRCRRRLVCPQEDPIRQGQQRYQHLVMQMTRKEVEIRVNLPEVSRRGGRPGGRAGVRPGVQACGRACGR